MAVQEGQPGWAVPVPWALRAAWHQLCLPQQMWDPEDALPWHLLLQPVKSRTRLQQCLPWRFPGCWAVVGQQGGIGAVGAALLVLGCPGVLLVTQAATRTLGGGEGGGEEAAPWQGWMGTGFG